MEKAEKEHFFSVSVVLFDMEMHLNSATMRGQGYLVTMTKGHVSIPVKIFKQLNP